MARADKVGRGNSEHISVRYVWQRSFGVNTKGRRWFHSKNGAVYKVLHVYLIC